MYEPIKKELEDISNELKWVLEKNAYHSIKQMGDYLSQSLGKRIRPALLCYTVKGCSEVYPYEDLIQLGVAIELIHMASLIHDDVLDQAMIRHHQDTIFAKWGINMAIPMGVYLYSLALERIAQTQLVNILSHVSHTVKLMCEGEICQISERGNLLLSFDEYMEIVKQKTGSLFSFSCRCGAILAVKDKTIEENMAEFGMNIGILFQLVDDILDIMDSGNKLKKKVGQDISLGEVTLPIILLMPRLSLKEQKQLKQHLIVVNEDSLQAIKALLKAHHIHEDMSRILASYEARSRKNLEALSPSIYKESLTLVLDSIVNRVDKYQKESMYL